MSSLSVCVIAKNEEKFLAKSLSSIAPAADEIIFVDTGSQDKTVKIAKKFTDNISYFKWIDDFSAAHNFSTDKAKMDYVFRWDADFYIPKDSLRQLLALKKNGFSGKNMIATSWLDIDTTTKKPRGVVMRDMIYKRGEFRSVSPVHSRIIPDKGVAKHRLVVSSLVIEHHRDGEEKSHRYQQSYQIIKTALKDSPNDKHLHFHLILAYIYCDEFALANKEIDDFLLRWPNYEPSRVMTALEKKLACLIALDRTDDIQPAIMKYKDKFGQYLQFQLLEADVLALSNPVTAKEIYKAFIDKDPEPADIEGPFIYSRYKLHPLNMLVRLEDDPDLINKHQTRIASLLDSYQAN